MLEVKGFHGFRFAAEKVGTLDDVLTPPWDVITPEDRRVLIERSPYNMAHVLLPDAEGGRTRYKAAGRDLESWITDGALRQDQSDSFYLLEQEFADLDGYIHTRRGFFGVTRLPEPGQRLVLGHERTFSGPTEDRLRLIEATRANLGPVFVLYADPENELGPFLDQTEQGPPNDEVQTYDGVIQRIWQVPHDDAVTAFFRDKKLYIADGHHRFHTAGVYRDAMRARELPDGPRPYDYVLMGFVALTDPGLQIYPPHRLAPIPEDFRASTFLADLKRWFEVRSVEEDFPSRVKAQSGCTIGVAINGIGDYLLTLRDIDRTKMLGEDHGPAWRNLDVVVLHRGIIEGILGFPEDTQFVYEHDAGKALQAIRRGDYGLAFLLKAVQSEEVCACAEAGDPMPQKSTYFSPKLPSGAVIHRLV